MSEKILEYFPTDLLGPIIIIFIAILVYKIVCMLLNKMIINRKTELDAKRHKTIALLLQNIIKYVVIILSVIYILQIYDVDTTSFVAGLGIAGIVVGLALQDALRDIIGGINIILDNYFVLGDIVEFNTFRGTVIEFGLKSTKIKAENGEVLILANRSVDRIINISQKEPIIHIEIPTVIDVDVKKVTKVLEKVVEEAKKLDNVNSKYCEFMGIERIEPARIVYAIKVRCKQGNQYELRRRVLQMIKEAYDKETIKFG